VAGSVGCGGPEDREGGEAPPPDAPAASSEIKVDRIGDAATPPTDDDDSIPPTDDDETMDEVAVMDADLTRLAELMIFDVG